MATWISATIVSILTSGITTTLLNNWFTDKRAKREFKAKKIEELHRNFQHWLGSFQKSAYALKNVVSGGKSFYVSRDSLRGFLDTNAHHEINVLTSLYFKNEFIDVMKDINDATNKYHAIYTKIKSNPMYAKAVSYDDLRIPVEEIIGLFEGAYFKFGKQIEKLANTNH